MLNTRTEIFEMAETKGVEIKGLEEVPVIVQSRPMFDFSGVDKNILEECGVDPDSMWQANGLMNTAIFPDGRVEDLRIVSSQYQVLQHLESVKRVLNVIPDEFQLSGIDIKTSENGGKMFAKFNSGHELEIKKGDTVNYQMLVENSGDGTSKYAMSGGAWRMICSNGMVIPDRRVEQISKKKLHKGGLNIESEIAEFLQIMESSIESMGIWKTYTQKSILAPDLEKIMELMEVGPRVREDLLNTELRGDNKSPNAMLEEKSLTAWDIYNAFTQRITDSEAEEAVKIEKGAKVSQAFDKFLKVA